MGSEACLQENLSRCRCVRGMLYSRTFPTRGKTNADTTAHLFLRKVSAVEASTDRNMIAGEKARRLSKLSASELYSAILSRGPGGTRLPSLRPCFSQRIRPPCPSLPLPLSKDPLPTRWHHFRPPPSALGRCPCHPSRSDDSCRRRPRTH